MYIDLNKMTLEEVLQYCKEREVWILQLFIDCEGFEKVVKILAENNKI